MPCVAPNLAKNSSNVSGSAGLSLCQSLPDAFAGIGPGGFVQLLLIGSDGLHDDDFLAGIARALLESEANGSFIILTVDELYRSSP